MHNANEKASIKPQELERVKAIQLYREGINELLNLKINQDISNGLPDHASVLFEQFFKHAKERVVIFCKNLCADVFDVDFVLSAAKQAYKRGVKIEVMIQDPTPNSKSFVDFIVNSKDIALKRVDPNYQHIEFNYSVMDNRAYRFEADRNTIAARANMNDEKTAALLLENFNSLRYYSKPLLA